MENKNMPGFYIGGFYKKGFSKFYIQTELLLTSKGDGMSLWTELFLYEACRAELVTGVIAPALKGDEGAGVDYKAHGSSAGSSAQPMASRSFAKLGSGGPSVTQASTTSLSEAVGRSGMGTTRATGSPLRSTTKESPR